MLLVKASLLTGEINGQTLYNITNLHIYRGDRIGLIGKNGVGKTHFLETLLRDQDHVELYAEHAYFKQINEELKEKQLSGGEKTLTALEQVFDSNRMLLILDEPTNNLDFSQREKLKQRLLQHKGAYIIVSHDRAFLDECCNTIWEIEDGSLNMFSGNYSFYKEEKEKQIQDKWNQYEQYTKEKKRLLERYRQKKQQALGMTKAPSRMSISEASLHKNKAATKQGKVERVSKIIQNRLDRLEEKEKPFEWDGIKMDYELVTPVHRKTVFFGKDLIAERGSVTLKSERLTLKTGTKTGVIGKNGSGKTTLINEMVTNERKADWAEAAKVGFFQQDLFSLPEDKTVLDYITRTSVLPEHMSRIILARLGFTEEHVHRMISVLSGGEKVKLAIASLLTGDYNVLILDEPTNHLDLYGIEALEKLLQEYSGTILFVSHDEQFVKNVATRLWKIENQTINTIPMGLEEYENEKNTAKESPTVDEERKKLLELKLSEVISLLSFATNEDEKEKYEKEYENLLAEKKRL